MIAILLISFMLEGICSNLLSTTIFLPLFSIISLVIVYPYFKDNKNKFFVYAASLGLLYDIVYTNCPFVNTFSFFITALMIYLIYEYITVSKFNVTIINVITILFHQTVSYIILCLFSNTIFNEGTFFTILYSSVLANVIYGFVLYMIVLYLDKNHKLKKYNNY